MATARKGVSSLQLSKEIGVTQKTAWFMLGRLREAWDFDTDTLDGIVEVDETSIGGKERNKHESRALSQRGFLSGIGRSESRPARLANRGKRLPDFLAAKNLNPFIDAHLAAASAPIRFQPPGGGTPAFGYQARLLTQVCDVYLEARAAGALYSSQYHVAERAELLIRGLAQVGIIGLVDEATGYQRIREERALATILERFIAEEFQPWTRTFPFIFYEPTFRLKGWGNAAGVKRPQVIGHYTNDIVYDRLAPGVLSELRERNPVLPQGWRRNRHHQWFTPEYGHPRLKERLEGVTALMRAATSWNGFKRSLDRVYPQLRSTIAMPIGEDADQEVT